MASDNYGDAVRLSKQIISFYEKRNVPIEIDKWDIIVHGKRYKFRVIFKKKTKIDFIRRYAKDAQFYLELVLFQVVEEGTTVYIVASRKLPKKNGWRHILESQEYSEACEEMGIAHPVGIDAMGNMVISDLTKYPHAVVAGTTRSGKSVALKSLILTLVCIYPPKKVNLLIGDGASDLQQFSGLPHLSYPVINDGDSFFGVVLILKEEMERRIGMKQTDEFKQLPGIIFVIDEFSSFVSGNMKDKRKLGLLTEAISELLRRGRHAKIHLILAVHNPTKQNMRIDMGDIPVKLVFRVSNVHNSVTVLGEGGAEKLKGEGDMYFYHNGERERLLGTYISEDEAEGLLLRDEQYEDERQLNVVDSNVTLDEWFDMWMDTCKKNCRDTTKHTYTIQYNRLREKLGWRKLTNLNLVIIQDAFNDLKTDASRRDCKALLVDMLNRAMESDLLNKNVAFCQNQNR